ncbi:hypothetical protein, partial [Saccharothrix sp. ST-888]|uniref:hypothetical protein n=1 Tax=Saccharothrix sp. ST-888 TaxID=1427391 RepID=UPI0005ED060B
PGQGFVVTRADERSGAGGAAAAHVALSRIAGSVGVGMLNGLVPGRAGPRVVDAATPSSLLDPLTVSAVSRAFLVARTSPCQDRPQQGFVVTRADEQSGASGAAAVLLGLSGIEGSVA